MAGIDQMNGNAGPNFKADNEAFEAWLRTQCKVVEDDLAFKHERMSKDAFTFLRATYFRWAKRIEAVCPELAKAPAVLSVGDTHIENFGTWRDADGRLVWGINDFDEAAVIPYPFDLVRLAASARLAPQSMLDTGDAARAIATGYRRGLEQPRPTLLDEQNVWMRPFVVCSDADRARFWNEVEAYPTVDPPADAADCLRSSLPETATVERFVSRRKGGGGLGRPRYIAIAAWRGGRIVREAKALISSAWEWAHGDGAKTSAFLDLANGKFRSPDPFLRESAGFIVRRIAADSRKIDLPDNAGAELNLKLLDAMGFDLGAIHGAGDPQAILKDLLNRPDGWLHDAAKAAAESVKQDFAEWHG